MAPTSEAGLSSKEEHYIEEGISDVTSLGSFENPQYVGDFDNSCETFFCRRNSPLLSRSVMPEASSTFRKVLGDMDNLEDEEDDNSEGDGVWLPNTSNPPSSSSLPSLSSTVPRSKPISTPSRKLTSSQSNFLSVPMSSSLAAFGSPSHADIVDSGAHKTLAGLTLRKSASGRPSSFGGSDSERPDAGFSRHREKRVSWADERGTKHQLISIRLIRPRLSVDASIGVSATPSHSILRRQDQVQV